MELNFRLIPFCWLLVSFQRSTNLWSEWNHFVVSVKTCIVLLIQIINYEISSQDIITYTGKLIMYKQENTPLSACSVAFVIQKLVKFVIRKNPLFSLYETLFVSWFFQVHKLTAYLLKTHFRPFNFLPVRNWTSYGCCKKKKQLWKILCSDSKRSSKIELKFPSDKIVLELRINSILK